MKCLKWFFLLLGAVALTASILMHANRLFLKSNDGFSIRTILSDLPYEANWEIPSLTSKDKELIAKFLHQKFVYLAKGHQTYVFESEDGNLVLKLYRFPSHLRPFSWINHPIAYRFSPKRKEIKRYNLEKLALSFQSYVLAYKELKNETGLIFIHLNKTDCFKNKIRLIDRLGVEYSIDPNTTVFLLQKKAKALFPYIKEHIKMKDLSSFKKSIEAIIDLFEKCNRLGLLNQDPILRKNYGWLEDKAIIIDVGRLTQQKQMPFSEKEMKGILKELEDFLKNQDVSFFRDYREILEKRVSL